MKELIRILLLICVFSVPVAGLCGEPSGKQELKTVKKERIHIRKGNKLYASKRFADAEVEYRKALQENPQSQTAMFNLATSLLKQSAGSGQSKDKNDPLNQAENLLGNVVKTTANAELLNKAYYDLGNIAYRRQQYDKAIEHYKNALRKNPGDDEARDNLRLAQLKKKEGGKDNQNKNQNKQDKDKQKQQQNQNQQNQNKNQNNQNKQQQPQPVNMSQQNIEQILKTMQDKEESTQRKVNASKAQREQNERRRTQNEW